MSLYCAWVISLLGTLVSLGYSHILHIEPCPLCWWQRIALFPLVLILGIAAYRGDRGIAIYTIPLVAVGLGVASYQYVLGERACSACAQPMEHLLSLASAIGFFAIGTCLFKSRITA